VSNGYLDYYIHTEGGKALTAAPCPLISQNGQWGGSLHGRYSVRFRADSLPVCFVCFVFIYRPIRQSHKNTIN
jgi:hypothetical protein